MHHTNVNLSTSTFKHVSRRRLQLQSCLQIGRTCGKIPLPVQSRAKARHQYAPTIKSQATSQLLSPVRRPVQSFRLCWWWCETHGHLSGKPLHSAALKSQLISSSLNETNDALNVRRFPPSCHATISSSARTLPLHLVTFNQMPSQYNGRATFASGQSDRQWRP